MNTLQTLSDTDLDAVTGGLYLPPTNSIQIKIGKIVATGGYASKGGTAGGGTVTVIGQGGNTYNYVAVG